MNKMTNIDTLASELLSSEPLFLGRPEYQRTTLEEMRADVLNRVHQTLAALEDYQSGKLDAPMAKSVRNGIAIKVGYGRKNEALMMFKDTFGGETDTLRANGRTRSEQRAIALKFFQGIAPLIQDGALDTEMQAKLASYRERAEQGARKRRTRRSMSELQLAA